MGISLHMKSICSKGRVYMKSKLIMNPTMARKLLLKGNPIIDIKPKKENPRETIFVFNLTDKLLRDMDALSK